MSQRYSKKELLEVFLKIPAETRAIEFKRLGDQKKIVAKIIQSIVAMANTDGGYFIIGIGDPEKSQEKGIARIHGIEENHEVFDEIGRELQRIIPPLAMVWPPLLLKAENNKTVAMIVVPKSGESLHSIDNKVYVRLEKGNKLLSPHEVIKYSYARGITKADKELVDVDFDLLNTQYFHDWRNNREIKKEDIKEVLFHSGLARKNEKGILWPTRAAVLLFAKYPHTLMETKSAIRVLQFAGKEEIIEETLNLIGAPKTIDGPIVELIEKAHNYILTLLRAGMKIPQSGFITKYRIPERAVKEAITNAVIHRDYYMKRDIEVKIFEDRVEVISPGLFPYNITGQNIGKVRAEGYRNDLLVKHLREFPDPPNLDQNEGVRAMRSEMDINNLLPPIFKTYPEIQDSVKIILRNAQKPSEWEKVKTFLDSKRFYITNEDVRNITGVSDTLKASKLLTRWVQQGILIKWDTSAKRNAKYCLPDALILDIFK
jgi:ATP-dependent DNA helicase RecG